MYILQESLFSFEELQTIESRDRLPIFFGTLDLRPCVKELSDPSPRGADGHCRQGILRALLAAPLENMNTFTGLQRRLEMDFRFRYQCGLRLDRKTPSISALSRVFAQITKAIIPMNLRNEKEPPAGMISRATPCCSMGFEMTYWGVDGDHLEFHSPMPQARSTVRLGWPHAHLPTMERSLKWIRKAICVATQVHIGTRNVGKSLQRKNKRRTMQLQVKNLSNRRCHARLGYSEGDHSPEADDIHERMIFMIHTMDSFCQKACKDVHLEAFCPRVDIEADKVKIIMISESLPKRMEDYFYSGVQASFFQTTQTAFADAGYEIKHPSEFIDKGIYLTTAIKCTKKDYLVSAHTIKQCSFPLEKELEPFKNVKVMMCMGDFAIKAVNYIFKRKFGVRVIPAGSTYKIRHQEYKHHGIRFYPSYTQTGDSFNIEKSKRAMIAEDIRSAMEYVRQEKF